MKRTDNTNRLFLYAAITFFWTFVIFSFSLQNAETSSSLSSGFGRWLMETFFPSMLDRLERMTIEELDFLHHLLRKCCHFAEYYILGTFSMLTFGQSRLSCRCIWAEVLCVLVASMDETIQLFSDGRSGQISDVILDSTGAAVGIVVLYLLRKRILYKKLIR